MSDNVNKSNEIEIGRKSASILYKGNIVKRFEECLSVILKKGKPGKTKDLQKSLMTLLESLQRH